jgi:hypothetical protein
VINSISIVNGSTKALIISHFFHIGMISWLAGSASYSRHDRKSFRVQIKLEHSPRGSTEIGGRFQKAGDYTNTRSEDSCTGILRTREPILDPCQFLLQLLCELARCGADNWHFAECN